MPVNGFIAIRAGSAELIRIGQKDRSYIAFLTNTISDLSRHILPIGRWIQWQPEIQLMGRLVYYGLTTILGNQTLGEEYCNVIQIGNTIPSVETPGVVRRTLSTLFQVVGPYIIEKMLEHVQLKLSTRSLPCHLNEERYQQLMKAVEGLLGLASVLSQLHLALFYLEGVYYELSKRLTGICYLIFHYSGDVETTRQMNPYKLLGWLLILQLLLRACRWLESPSKAMQNRKCYFSNRESTPEVSTLKCSLCLEMCRVPSSTLCGHIFCWTCASEWTSEKMECPMCRRTAQPQELVCLQHFEPGN